VVGAREVVVVAIVVDDPSSDWMGGAKLSVESPPQPVATSRSATPTRTARIRS
jgi:hypothetical protein